MKHEFVRKAPWTRLALGLAAVIVTASIAGFIDFLATEHVAIVADLLHGPVLVAKAK